MGGLICLTSGLLWIVGWTLDIHRDSLIGAELVLPGYVLAIFAFTAIAGIHFEKLSIIGLIGYFLIIIANALFIPWAFLDISRLSGTTPGVDWYFVERNGPTGVIAIIGGFSFVFGYILFGSDLIRIKLINRWPAILLLLAAIQPLIFPIIQVGKMLPRIAGLSLILFAYQLWSYNKSKRSF